MPSVYGRKAKPLDVYTEQRIRSLGWKPLPVARTPGVLSWRHVKHRGLGLDLTVSNIPGDTDVTVQVDGGRPARLTADALVSLLEFYTSERDAHTQKEA